MKLTKFTEIAQKTIMEHQEMLHDVPHSGTATPC